MLKAQSFNSTDYNGQIDNFTDKIKCPSLTELGCYCAIPEYNDDGYLNYARLDSGSIYPLFGTQQLCPNPSAIMHINPAYGGKADSYWTRTSESSVNVYYVDGNGHNGSCNYKINELMVIGIIRF